MTEFLLNHTLYLQGYCFLWYLLFSINQLHACCPHHFRHWSEILQDFQDRLQLHGALCSVLHVFFQWIFSPLFKATICTLVCFCHCRIYAQIFHICITGKRMKNFFPYTIFLPFSESCIDTLPWSIAFCHFSPLSSRSCNPQHSIQHDAVIFCRSSSFACSLCWQLVFDSFPFAIADFISFHSSILSFLDSLCKFYFSNKA